MRLWSLHPKYLDTKGLIALWRESLLAQKVLKGDTRGYRYHPQLHRFRQHPDPLWAVGHYLYHVWQESEKRGFHFSKGKIFSPQGEIRPPAIEINRGQLIYEYQRLLEKLKTRDPDKYSTLLYMREVEPHPLFITREGGIERWERA